MESRAHSRTTFTIFWQHSMRYPLRLAAVIGGISAATFAMVYQPTLYKTLFDTLATRQGNPYETLLRIALVSAFIWVSWRLATFANASFQPRVMADLATTCFKSLTQQSYAFFHDRFAGSLVRRANRFPDAFETFSDQFFWNLLPTIIRVSSIIVILSFRSIPLTLAIGLWCLTYITFCYFYVTYSMRFGVRRAAADSAVTAHLSDVLSNILNLKLFGGVERETATFSQANETLFRLRRFTWNLDNLSDTIQGGLMVILEILVIWLALRGWEADTLTVGDVAMLQTYVVLLFDQLWSFNRTVSRIYRSFSDADEMTETLLTPPSVQNTPKARALQINQGEISFENVTFRYNDASHPVFQNFNLQIKAGEKVALIGPSGGGKSSTVKLLFRFFDIQEGRVCIDGQNIAEGTLESLRAAIALVPQDPVLFHRSIMENIRYAKPDATDEAVIAAAKQAHCHEFIRKLPKGYNTHVGERGVKLSGGERQRVAIARAILKNAPILVLDEATSALDSESEQHIQAALSSLMEGRTTIVIAHRLSTIRRMDRIVVLENGQVAEEGKHEELLKASQGTYQRLWEIQAGAY